MVVVEILAAAELTRAVQMTTVLQKASRVDASRDIHTTTVQARAKTLMPV